jgi:hypothetical protein
MLYDMSICFISLHIGNSCGYTMYGGLGMQKLGWNDSDGYNIGMWELAVADKCLH